MTTHDRDKVLAAAKEAVSPDTTCWLQYEIDFLERFYAIAFEAGAAIRDAEIDDLGESLAQVKLKSAMLIKERDQLRKDVTLLRDAVKFWMRAEGNYDLMKADKKLQEALAATEPKP